MSRTLSAAERAAVAALRSGHFSKFEVQDADGVYRDYTQYLRTDWFTGASIEESQDQTTMTLNATLLRESGTLSLSPFVAASLVNRNAGGSYAAALDVWRRWRLSLAVMREGYPPTGTDWKEVCQGRIDRIDWAGEQIQITGRGEEAVLIDFWIATERQYGSVGGIAMETTVQSEWDDNLGAAAYTLSTPVSPSYLMNTWTQQKGKLFAASTDIVANVAGVLRFRYDSSHVFRPTLFLPNRAAAPGSELWTVGANEITGYNKVAVDKQGIRNFIKIRFVHPTLGVQTVISPWMAGTGTVTCVAGVATFSSSQAGIIKTTGSNTEIIVGGIAYTVTAFNGTTGATLLSQLASGGVPTFGASSFTLSDTLSGAGTTASISSYGRNDLEIDRSYSSQLNDATKAQAMADAIRSDLELSDVEQEFETQGFWFAQLHDYGKFEANGKHYDQAQYGGVTRIRHEIANGRIKSTIGVRGKPSGAYAAWRRLGRWTVVQRGAIPPLDRRTPYGNDGKYAAIARDSSGVIIDSSVQQDLAGTPRALAKGYQAGFTKDDVAGTGVVTFNPVYQNLPQILLRGGKAANATFPYDDFAAQSASASGFTCRAKNKDKGVITARTAEFTASLTVTTVGSTVGPATLASAPSYDNNYTARFGITVTLVGGPGQVTAVVAVESNDGVSGWIERATRSYVAGTTAGTYTYTLREVSINDSTLGLNDQIRLKLKSLTVSGPGGTTGSASLTGYDNSGGNGHGVTYSTSPGPSFQTKTPDADDYIFWEAFEVTT